MTCDSAPGINDRTSGGELTDALVQSGITCSKTPCRLQEGAVFVALNI